MSRDVPNARRLILALLLAQDGAPLSAREAVMASGLFDIRPNNVRVALVRLAAAGLVEAAGRGTYRLGPNATELAAEVARWRLAESRVRDWTGAYVAVHWGIPSKSDRTALRRRDRALTLLGFRELRRGLHLRPDNLEGGVSAIRARLHALGLDPEAEVFVATGFDARREAEARKLWDGKALDASYRKTRERLDRWLERAPTLDADAAARESFLLGDRAIRQIVFDPWLPPPLVDAGLRRAFVESTIRFDAAGHAIWRRFFDEAPASAGVELLQ